MVAALKLTPYYSVMTATAVLSFMVGGGITSAAEHIRVVERRDAVVSYIMDQPLRQVVNLNIPKKDL